MSAPRLTIGLPVYNGEAYLAETLESLLGQDFDDFELVVSDNASTDATVRIVESFAERDSRVRLVRNDRNLGAASNYNRLVADSRAELFKWSGYDDLVEPGYVGACISALDANPAAVLAFTQAMIIDGAGRHVREYDERLDVVAPTALRRVASFTWRFNLCNPCFGVMRRDAMASTGLIRPYVSSDVTFLAEMAALGSFTLVDQHLFQRRIHEHSSRQGSTSAAELARWFNPAARGAPALVRLKLLGRTTAALATGAAPLPDRFLAASGFAAAYSVRRARIAAGQYRDKLRSKALAPSEKIHTADGTRT